ncbi:MAG TPA: STAS domain-containing protein [Candidatus Polarisedimenticolia bacterium]|nr:STAS domain-containing protein [Candidatus Polarisedimenticolia bacterium]
MNVKREERRGVHLIALSGSVDNQSANALREELNTLLRSGSRRFVLDLRSLDSLSQPILRVLLWLSGKTSRECVVLCVDPPVSTALDRAGLKDKFLVADSEKDAIARVSEIHTLSPLTGTLCRVLGVASITDVVEELVLQSQAPALAVLLLQHLALPAATERPGRRGADRRIAPSAGSFDRPSLESGN